MENKNPMAVAGVSSGYVNCNDVASKIYEYLDGELTEDKRKAIQFHLDHCAPCVEVFEFENDLRKLVSCKCQEKVPDTLKQRIAAVISMEEQTTKLFYERTNSESDTDS
jgi:mycothiol system anti-sigma-R factor